MPSKKKKGMVNLECCSIVGSHQRVFRIKPILQVMCQGSVPPSLSATATISHLKLMCIFHMVLLIHVHLNPAAGALRNTMLRWLTGNGDTGNSLSTQPTERPARQEFFHCSQWLYWQLSRLFHGMIHCLLKAPFGYPMLWLISWLNPPTISHTLGQWRVLVSNPASVYARFEFRQ